MRESWYTMNIKNEMTVENFNYSNVEKCISDFSHVDKVRFGVYCAELVIDIYEKYNLSKAPRLAIEAAKKWIESTTEENKKECKSDDARVAAADAALDARVAASAARVAADSFSAAAAANAAALVAAADDAASASASASARAALAAAAASASDADASASADALAASADALAAGESIKENIVNWLNEFKSKNIETPEEKEALESISGKITIDIERYKELCGFEREIKIRDLMKETAFSRDACNIIVDAADIKKVPTDVLTKSMESISIIKFSFTLTRRYINRLVSRLLLIRGNKYDC